MMKQRKRTINWISVILTILVVCNVYTMISMSNTASIINDIGTKIQHIEDTRMSSEKGISDKISKVAEDLDIVKTFQESTMTKRTQPVSRAGIHRELPKVEEIKSIDSDTDLCGYVFLTDDDMDKIIDSWDDRVRNGTSFKNKGHVFIQASRETGLNPIYILAHAAWESNWGNSYLAKNRGNYFGINAIDSNPDKAYAMGSSVDEGIVEGAKWIKSEYYDNGCTTLNEMIYKGNYASDKGKWINGITNIANTSYKVLSK